MGSVKVPASAYYGAQTQRAIENFRISGLVFPRRFIRALGIVKKASAEVNMQLGILDEKKGRAVAQAAQEVVDGKLDQEFVVELLAGVSLHFGSRRADVERHRLFHLARALVKGAPYGSCRHAFVVRVAVARFHPGGFSVPCADTPEPIKHQARGRFLVQSQEPRRQAESLSQENEDGGDKFWICLSTFTPL